MAYDPNKDYMEEMRRRAAAGDEAGFDAAQTARNEKIGATGSSYAKTNYTMGDFARQNGIASVPAVNPNPTPGKLYNPNINYTQNRLNDEYNGNIAGAMVKERFHNTKDGDMGLGWGATDFYNYQDYQGLGGLREAKYNEIEDYFKNGFNYDYTTDAVYQSILKSKTKQGNKAYQDMLAQYSKAFDGDIPVNMLNKAAATKGEIIDQADSYIPTLRQMAENMYLNKGNQLIGQYNMLDEAEQNQYNRWLADRNLYTEGVLNNYGNRMNKEAMDYQRQGDGFNRLLDLATIYYNDDPNIDWNEAVRRAQASNILY